MVLDNFISVVYIHKSLTNLLSTSLCRHLRLDKGAVMRYNCSRTDVQGEASNHEFRNAVSSSARVNGAAQIVGKIIV